MRQAFPTWSARGVSVVMGKRKVFDRGAKFILAVWIAFVVAMSAGCAKKEGAGINYLGSFFSSDVMLFIAEDIPAEDYADMISACKEAMEEYDAAFSLARDDGELARFNAAASGERVKISALTENVLKKARSLFLSTGGAFDPTVYPLVDLWGFSHRFDALYEPAEIYDRVMGDDGSLPPPEKEYIDAFVRLADFSEVVWESSDDGIYLVKNCPPVTVDGEIFQQRTDLSAIAKGELSSALEKIVSRVTENFYISIGTSSLYLGARQGENWRVQLTDPASERRAAFAETGLKNVFLSTSGTYEKNYLSGGVKYHHVIDPATGTSADTDILSVTVVGEDGGACDALSTALIVMGYEKACEYVKSLSGYDFVFVLDNGKVYSTLPLTDVGGRYDYYGISL